MILPVGPSGTTKYIYRIFFEVTIFQHTPLTRRVFYNKTNNNNNRIKRTSSTSSGWHIYKSLEAFQHHIVFIFNIWRQQLFNQHQHLLTFWSATSSTLWSFDQQHLQHLDLLINSNIFSTLTFRSATSSTLWPFDQQQHIQHFDLSIITNIFSILIINIFSTLISISKDIFSILTFQSATSSHSD